MMKFEFLFLIVISCLFTSCETTFENNVFLVNNSSDKLQVKLIISNPLHVMDDRIEQLNPDLLIQKSIDNNTAFYNIKLPQGSELKVFNANGTGYSEMYRYDGIENMKSICDSLYFGNKELDIDLYEEADWEIKINDKRYSSQSDVFFNLIDEHFK